MQLWLLDSNRAQIKVLGEYESVITRRRFDDHSEWRGRFPAHAAPYLTDAAYVVIGDEDDAYMVEWYDIDDDTVEAGGRSATALLEGRAVWGPHVWQAVPAGEVVRDLVVEVSPAGETLHSDDFNRANSGTLGAGYTTILNDVVISSNAAGVNKTSQYSFATIDTVPSPQDGTHAEITFTADTLLAARVAQRSGSTWSGYVLARPSANVLKIHRQSNLADAGTRVEIASWDKGSAIAGGRYGISLDDGTVGIYDVTYGGDRATATDANYASGKFALGGYGIASIGDDLSVGNARRTIAGLAFGTGETLGDDVTLQRSWHPIGEVCYEVAKAADLGLRSQLDGTDIAIDVLERPDTGRIVGARYGNVAKAKFSRDVADWCNYAVVLGEGDGDSRVRVEVDATDGDARRELYVDARDLQSEVDGTTYSDTQYRAMLRQRGLEELAQHRVVEYAEADAILRLEAGEVVLYESDAWSGTLVATEVTAIYESGATTYGATLGEPEPRLSTLLK